MRNKSDRRVQRTIKLLKDSLIELTLEKGYDSVTIQEITDHANLGRATFYIHYRDKDELLLEILDEIATNLIEEIQSCLPVRFDQDDNPQGKPVLKLFQYVENNLQLYRMILYSQGGVKISRRIHDYIAQYALQFIEEFSASSGVKPKLPLDFLANHFAGSLLATINWWVENDLPYPAAEMAKMFRQVSLMGRGQSLGIIPALFGKKNFS